MTGDPVIQVRGPATAEDVAALVAVLAAVPAPTAHGHGHGHAPADGAQAATASTWAAHRVAVRQPVGHGPAAWRTSLRP